MPIPVTDSQIPDLIDGFRDAKQTWHYHLLTPTCQFNDTDQFALYIENLDTEQTYALYSDVAKMELSNSLSKLLHGEEVMDQANTKADYVPTKEVSDILQLINKLVKQDVKWHHHVFFPGCTFNSNPDKFELIVEDPRTGDKRFVSITDNEPSEDLKQIESLFFGQNL